MSTSADHTNEINSQINVTKAQDTSNGEEVQNGIQLGFKIYTKEF